MLCVCVGDVMDSLIASTGLFHKSDGVMVVG